MTYATGSNISAGDLNNFIGANNVSTAYASAAAATGKVAALLGVGYGDRGYGQTTPALAPIAAGTPVRASHWTDLRTALATMASFQGTAQTVLPSAASFAAGSVIKAENSSARYSDFPTTINNVDSSRLNVNAANMSLVTGSITSTRSTAWGASATQAIGAEFTMTFTSEDKARYFFNSGGLLNMTLSHASTASTQNSNWNTILSALGTISFGAHSTTRSGTGGTPTSIGYYELTGTAQTVFSGAIGTGAYTANTITVTAWSTNIVGVNGAKGSIVKLKVVLTDGHTNTFSDTVAAGTTASIGYRKAATYVTGIETPAFTLTTAF